MRKKNSIKNFITTFIPYIILGILGFVRVKIFLNGFGEEISALNQLFNNIISYLTLAEGGIGLFIVQKYFKLLQDNNKKEINSYFSSSKIFLKRVGYFMLGSSILVSFLLKFLTNNNLNLLYMQITFFLFVFKNSIDYFMYAPRLVMQADQKLYKINLLINLSRVAEYIIEIILVLTGVNYLIILIPGIVVRFVTNVLINKKIFKEYTWLEFNNKYSKEKLKGMRHIINQKISGLIFNNTDTLLVSSFLKPQKVIIYTSYNYVTKYLCDLAYMISSSISSSLGNVFYSEKNKVQYQIFNEVNIMFYFIASIFSILFILLINPFISLWVGSKYYIGICGCYLITVIMFFDISRRTILTVKDNLGLFKETKKIILLEAILNVIISLILIYYIGLNGVLIGTIVSTLFTTFWYLPYYIYKNHFRQNCFVYFKNYFLVLLITLILPLLLKTIYSPTINSYLEWGIWALIYGIIVLIILLGLFYILFGEFRSFLFKIIDMFKNRLKSKN